MPNMIDTPSFQNETEEADWWESNQDRLLAAFQNAEQDGTLLRESGSAETLRLAHEDAAMAKEQAAKRGLEYHAYLQNIIHQALLHAAAQ